MNEERKTEMRFIKVIYIENTHYFNIDHIVEVIDTGAYLRITLSNGNAYSIEGDQLPQLRHALSSLR